MFLCNFIFIFNYNCCQKKNTILVETTPDKGVSVHHVTFMKKALTARELKSPGETESRPWQHLINAAICSAPAARPGSALRSLQRSLKLSSCTAQHHTSTLNSCHVIHYSSADPCCELHTYIAIAFECGHRIN